jgi:hypothetical protein
MPVCRFLCTWGAQDEFDKPMTSNKSSNDLMRRIHVVLSCGKGLRKNNFT